VSQARCFRVHPADNVATLLDDAQPGPLAILGQASPQPVVATEPIQLGHKVCLADLAADEPILKYGVPIGRATRPIRRGEWVHLHNCRSSFDERSSTLDLHTGAATDTSYE
jgi:altronate dehydratase small subunit